MSNQFKFDPNQKEWPSDAHKAVWQWGLYIMPEEITLSNQIRELMDDELYESCRQMRQFLLHSLSEMYESAEKYDFDVMQYLFMWYWLGKVRVIGHSYFTAGGKVHNKKLCEIAQMEKCCSEIFAKTGVVITPVGDKFEITNTIYPQMFLAMEIMHDYSRAKKEEVGGRNSFYMCDFRRICPGYKGKPDKVDDIARWLLSGEILCDLEQFLGFLRNEGMRFTKGWKDHRYGIKYKGEGIAGVGIEGPNRVCFGVGIGWDSKLYLDGQPQEVTCMLKSLMLRVHSHKCKNCSKGGTKCSKTLGRTIYVDDIEYKNQCVASIGYSFDSIDGDIKTMKAVIYDENATPQFVSLDTVKTLILAMKAYVDKTK